MIFRRRKKIYYPNFTAPGKPKRRKKKAGWIFWLGMFILFLLLGSAVYLFLFSPVFKIKEISVDGNSLIATPQIVEKIEAFLDHRILKIIPGNISIFLPKNRMKTSLLGSFLEIADVKIEKPQPDKLDVLIFERKPAAVLCRVKIVQPSSVLPASATSSAATSAVPKIKEKLPESEDCYFVDKDGFAYRRAPQISGTLLPAFYLPREDEVLLGSALIDSATIQFAVEAKNNLRELVIDLNGFAFNEIIPTELKAFAHEGWFIYFDTGRPALVQVAVLEALLENEVKNKRANLEYVDLRVANRVYYK